MRPTATLASRAAFSLGPKHARVSAARAGAQRRCSHASVDKVTEADYVIVGGGTAGCVLANRLSKDPSTRVVLLEAGGEPDWIWYKIPIGYLFTMMNERSDWRFKTTPQEALNGRQIAMPRGKVLGGCSSINGQIYMRGQKADYDAWGAENEGWSWDEVLPHFRRGMDYFLGADEAHGVGGEWKVAQARATWGILDTFQRAAEEKGLPLRRSFNNSDEAGCGYFEVNQHNGLRVSSATAFLDPVRTRNNLLVETNARTDRIRFRDPQEAAGAKPLEAEGVEYRKDGLRCLVRAKREVVLAAGAVGSPHLLEVSGVGNPRILEENGVRVLHSSPGVGEHLADHLQIRPVWRLKDGTVTMNSMTQSYASMLQMGLQYAFKRSGPLSMAPSTFGAIAYSSDAVATPDLEFHLQALSCERLELGHLDPYPGMTVSVCNLRPSSRGSSHLTSPTIDTPPTIDPNYLATHDDRDKAVRSIKWARDLMSAPSFEHLAPVEQRPGAEHQQDDEILSQVGGIASSIFHPVSTCRMGRDDGANVVDAQLKTHCASKLRVVDASVMPELTSGNTCSPVIMIAEKASDMILQEHAANA